MPATDAELVLSARAGSTTAFASLYERYQLPVTRYARRIVHDYALAEDVVQEAFVSALRRLSTLRDPDRFRPWLFSIVHRAAVDVVRVDGPTLLPELPEPAVQQESSSDSTAAELVWDAAASLEPRQRAILELTLREQLTNSELAQALGVSTAHAAVLAHRTRSALGRAVRILLVVRGRHRCARLAALVPGERNRLTAAQRASVDRHLRRCPTCGAMVGTVTVPLAALAVLVFADQRTPYVSTSVVKPLVGIGAGAVVVAVLLLIAPGATEAPAALPPVPEPVPVITTAPLVVIATTPPAPTPAPVAAPVVAAPVTEEERLLILINDRRARSGCVRLGVDPRLATATRKHSKHMADNGYLAMAGPDGSSVADRVRAAGYTAPTGVALAASTETAADTLSTLDGGPAFSCSYRSVGIARAVGGGPCHFYWTIVFGRT